MAALLAEGANMDIVGAGYDEFTAAERNAVEIAHPHPRRFAEDFMQTLYDSLKHRPETTQVQDWPMSWPIKIRNFFAGTSAS
ncbi:hypothetical protein [Rhizobium sp. BK529]|uniref:hypothetical protein n=1 Tax=Rhizobium sp. BK529 TaxID=2586983 RepID=UPI001FEDE075|nr:hypothetical protein [Rhizobium sp. BK529]